MEAINPTLEPLFKHLAQQPPTQLIHYTGIDTLLSMVKAESPSFWLSNVSYLNDSKELMWGYELMTSLLKNSAYVSKKNAAALPLLKTFAASLGLKQNMNSHLYVMSFSESSNSLNQWRSYTPHGKGISLAFDLSDTGSEFIYNNGLELAKCIYDPKKQIELIECLIDHTIEVFETMFQEHDWPETIADLIGNEQFNNLYNYALKTGYKIFSLIKHPAFEDEKEWRLIAQTPLKETTEIDFRSGSSMLLPYLVTPINLNDHLTHIKIGPTSHKDLAHEAIAGLLRKYNYKGINLSISDIPYREWH